MKDVKKERLFELLADQTVFGLSEEEAVELAQLKTQFPDWEKYNLLEITAAMIGLSDLDTSKELPVNLRSRILVDAEKYFDSIGETQNKSNFASDKNVGLATTANAEFEPRRPFWQWLGLAVAAAACIALAINLWLTRSQPQPEVAETPKTVQTPEILATPESQETPEIVVIPEPAKTPETGESNKTPRNQETTKIPETNRNQEIVRSPKNANIPEAKTPEVKTPEIVRIPTPAKTPSPELSAAQKREQLLASAPDIIQTNWVSAKDKKVVLGDVVWSNAQQKGYVRLRDMPTLDPNQETYQLWIVDEAQNKKTPVSGGIFNVGQAGEAVIPINAQLKILKPKSFAISKEKAGGVVVTKPNRIVATAKL